MVVVHQGMPPTPRAVAFYFDPACPWTWVTSRWLVEAAAQRGFEIDWHPFSLKVHNGDGVPEEHRERVEASHAALRVIVRLKRELGDDAVAAFYAERGYRTFNDDVVAPVAAEVLAAAGLDESFAEAEGDESLDAAIRSSMDEAHARAGEGTGSPTVAFDDRGFFGPVLTAVPADAGALWDHLVALWAVPELHELKRDRQSDPVFPARP